MSGVAVSRCLWSPLESDHHGRDAALCAWTGRDYEAWSFDDWRAAAGRFARGLAEHGVRPGESVALIFENSLDACAALVGCWMAGATVLSFPLPARTMDLAHYSKLLATIVSRTSPALVVAPAPIVALASDALPTIRVRPFAGLYGNRWTDSIPRSQRTQMSCSFSTPRALPGNPGVAPYRHGGSRGSSPPLGERS